MEQNISRLYQQVRHYQLPSQRLLSHSCYGTKCPENNQSPECNNNIFLRTGVFKFSQSIINHNSKSRKWLTCSVQLILDLQLILEDCLILADFFLLIWDFYRREIDSFLVKIDTGNQIVIIKKRKKSNLPICSLIRRLLSHFSWIVPDRDSAVTSWEGEQNFACHETQVVPKSRASLFRCVVTIGKREQHHSKNKNDKKRKLRRLGASSQSCEMTHPNHQSLNLNQCLDRKQFMCSQKQLKLIPTLNVLRF